MKTISLNGKWSVRLDRDENGLAECWAGSPIKKEYEVTVPGCIQQLDELSADFPPHNDMRNGYEGTFFMEKTFSIPLGTKNSGKHIRLYIGGVGPTCHIWINGKYSKKNIFGLCHIYYDITDCVTDGENRITVAVTEQYSGLVSGERFAGMNWSGIYSDCYVEIGGAVYFENPYISYSDKIAQAEGTLVNSGDDFDGDVVIRVNRTTTKKRIKLSAGDSVDFCIPIKNRNLPLWSYNNPELVDVQFSCEDSNGNLSKSVFKTGVRDITVKENRILVNNKPTFFKGTGSEYFSPTIAPLTDREIIISRYEAVKAYGFNFYRCHTHIPTEEEMCIADEMGIMLDVEFGLVSNFNKTTPIEEGFSMWREFILQSRRHPSVFVYCIGNEGSQLMVDSLIERNRAKLGYKIIKENTKNQLGIIAFGMQGELPELPNDFETPHLWSENFLWSYDGLTDIPWNYLEKTTNGKPCIIHEYGKFGVWPSRKEENDTTVENGIKPDHGTQSYNWLKANNLEIKERTLIENSRKSANRFNRIILEDARRQPYVSGYALWTFFRRTASNAGLSDDLGCNLNGETEMFKNGCNADIALLMDRGFKDRAIECGVVQTIGITVSNFSDEQFSGKLNASLYYENEKIAEFSNICQSLQGETYKKLNFVFTVPVKYSNKKLTLSATFVSGRRLISQNSWDFWAFDTSAAENKVLLHINDITAFRELKRIFPNAQRLSSVDSILIGCRSWRNPQLVETAEKNKDIPIITDVYDDIIKECIKNGNKVLLIDSNNLPSEWMLPPICEDLGDRDTGRFYNSFRAGWDKGNLVTLVEDNSVLGKFPRDTFCDLQFYDMMQTARIMKPEKVNEVFGDKAQKIVSSISKLPPKEDNASIVQDPNAIKELNNANKQTFNAREQGYLLKYGKHLVISTLKLHDNPAGIGLIKNIIENL